MDLKVHSETSPRVQRHPVNTTLTRSLAGSETSVQTLTTTRRVDYLDGWRGIAILLVLQSHFLPYHDFDSGRLGVEIFFCLSGLLMSELLFIRRVPLATFYRRRISRILPAYIVFVAIVYGVAAQAGRPTGAGEVVSTFLFLRTYLPSQPDIWNTGLPIGHLWSLNVEEHSYVFLSLVALWAALSASVRGREAWVLAAAAAATVVVDYFYIHSPSMAGTNFEIHSEIAATPLLLSAAYRLVRDRVAHFVKPWMPLVALALALFAYLPNTHWWTSDVVTPLLLAFAANHLRETSAAVRGLLSTRLLRQFGIWSYSIYLWQQPFFMYKSSLPAGLAVLGAMLAALISFYLVEGPCRAWINEHF